MFIAWSRTVKDNTQKAQPAARSWRSRVSEAGCNIFAPKKKRLSFSFLGLVGKPVGRVGGCAPVLHIAEETRLVLQLLWRCRSRGPRTWPAGTCFNAKGLEHDSVHDNTASTDTRFVHQTECSIPAYISSLGDPHGMMEWSYVSLFLVFKGTSVILGICHCPVPQGRASVS